MNSQDQHPDFSAWTRIHSQFVLIKKQRIYIQFLYQMCLNNQILYITNLWAFPQNRFQGLFMKGLFVKFLHKFLHNDINDATFEQLWQTRYIFND